MPRAAQNQLLRPTYLSATESDGTFKWYVAISKPFTDKWACLTGYGPKPDPDGTFHPVTPTSANSKIREKIDQKGYTFASHAEIPEVARERLLDQIQEMTGCAYVRMAQDGTIEVAPNRPLRPRHKPRPNAVWI